MLLLISKLFKSLIRAAVWGADKGSGLDLKRSEKMKELLCQLPKLRAHHLTLSLILIRVFMISSPSLDRSAEAGPRCQAVWQEEPKLAGLLNGIRLQKCPFNPSSAPGGDEGVAKVLVSKAPPFAVSQLSVNKCS